MTWWDRVRSALSPAPPALEEVVYVEPEPPPDPIDDEEQPPITLHWLEQGPQDIVYSLQDILTALGSGKLHEFGLYDTKTRRVVLPVSDRGSLVLAVKKYRPPRYYFAYRTAASEPFTPLYLVMDATYP